MFNRPTDPLPADEAELRSRLANGNIAVLLMAVAALSGDPAVLRPEWRPRVAFGADELLAPEDLADARELCLRVLLESAREGIEPAPPGEAIVRAALDWIGVDRPDDHLELLAEELVPPGADAKAPAWHRDDFEGKEDFRVAIIGAGVSGLAMGYRLAQAGVPFVIYEKNPDVGGTWFENHYPGCRVDIPNQLYSYSFASRTDWPEHFCTQPVLQDYFRRVADEFGLREHVEFDTEVTAAMWDEESATWQLTVRGPAGTRSGRCAVLVSAVGQLNRPSYPDIPHRDRFPGPAFHSARWDHALDLRDKRVAVIGTGASAIQFVPELARQAGHVTVFQRTPAWLIPTPDYHRPVTENARWLFEHVPLYAAWYRMWLLVFMPSMLDVLGACVVDPHYPPTEHAVSAANEALRAALLGPMEEQFRAHPDLRPHLLPDHPAGAKRMLHDNGSWMDALARDEVDLVTESISELTDGGVRTRDGVEHPADVIVYATGFAASGFLMPMRVRGRDGVDLHEAWAGDPRAYLGLTVPRFPNLFVMYGPNTEPVVHGSSIAYLAECQAAYVINAVGKLLAGPHDSLEVREEVHRDMADRIDQANAARAWGWSDVRSWYKNRAGRVTQAWPFSTVDFWRRTSRLADEDYDWDKK
jgi:4-hydroxyacetophenone monooxygenase